MGERSEAPPSAAPVPFNRHRCGLCDRALVDGECPVCSPAIAAHLEREAELERIFDAVGTVLDTDERSAPTTRQLAEALFIDDPEHPAALDGPEFKRAADLLAELERRRVVESHDCEPGYFGRDEEERVTRWTKTPAGWRVARARAEP